MSTTEDIKKVGEKISDIRSCLFVTRDGDAMKARPMGTQEVAFDGSVWFMTSKDSAKCAEIQKDAHVALMYAHGNGVTFASLSGMARLVVDKEKIRAFWNPFYKAWFEGPDDPAITLIEVKVSRAEYWDNKAGKVGGLADIAIGAVTGKQNTLDEHEVLTF